MERGDARAEDSSGFGTEDRRGNDRWRDDITTSRRQSGRSWAPSLKGRESQAAEVEARGFAAEQSRIAPLTEKTAPLTEKTNRLASPIQVAASKPYLPSPVTSSPPLKSDDTAKTAVARRADRFKQSHWPDVSEARAKSQM